MFIHSKIKILQEHVNRVAKEYDIEDFVISYFNAQIGNWNKRLQNSNWISISDPIFIVSIVSMYNDEKLVDFIYGVVNEMLIWK